MTYIRVLYGQMFIHHII